MIVVMQCAKTKRAEAGHMRLADGRPVVFVAQPELAPARTGFVYARPDDIADTGRTWREELVIYNQQRNPDVADIPLGRHVSGGLGADPIDHSSDSAANPLSLLPAWQLYKNKTYRLLADTFGPKNLYIFSAGWGLVRSDFMIPNYDITLSPNATGSDKYKRRRKDDPYDNFAMLPLDSSNIAQPTRVPPATSTAKTATGDVSHDFSASVESTPPSDAPGNSPIVFLGSKAYVPLFCQLTDGCSAHRIIFHNAKVPPKAPDCEIRKYDILKKTDWHYDAAKALAFNRITI